MKIINGWNEKEMQLLSERTKQPLMLVERFCEAVDKSLYLMLPEHLRRATLHFHLSPERVALLDLTKQVPSVPVEKPTIKRTSKTESTKPTKLKKLLSHKKRSEES
jgi:hypothetical protein